MLINCSHAVSFTKTSMFKLSIFAAALLSASPRNPAHRLREQTMDVGESG
jgi:hypothetical protein